MGGHKEGIRISFKSRIVLFLANLPNRINKFSVIKPLLWDYENI